MRRFACCVRHRRQTRRGPRTRERLDSRKAGAGRMARECLSQKRASFWPRQLLQTSGQSGLPGLSATTFGTAPKLQKVWAVSGTVRVRQKVQCSAVQCSASALMRSEISKTPNLQRKRQRKRHLKLTGENAAALDFLALLGSQGPLRLAPCRPQPGGTPGSCRIDRIAAMHLPFSRANAAVIG